MTEAIRKVPRRDAAAPVGDPGLQLRSLCERCRRDGNCTAQEAAGGSMYGSCDWYWPPEAVLAPRVAANDTRCRDVIRDAIASGAPTTPAPSVSGEVISVNAATGGAKGVKLERFDLIPVYPLTALARHFGVGARKYADRNWEKGYEWSKSYAAMQRHANLFWGGENYDHHKPECPEGCVEHTGSHHLTAVAWHAMALLEMTRTHPDLDNRPNVNTATIVGTKEQIEAVMQLAREAGVLP